MHARIMAIKVVNTRESLIAVYFYKILLFNNPRRRRRDIDLALSVRLFVCPSVCPDVRPSVTNLFGLYLKNYCRFDHETSGVYRSHWGEVHCTRTITLHCLILELFPFLIFHTFWILCGTNLSDFKRYQHETL